MFQMPDFRVLARPYLMLYIIFPIHLNFPVWPIIHRKKQWIVLRLFRKVFSFSKRHFYLEHYEAWKDEELTWSKTEIWLPRQCKISFLPGFLGYFLILSTISLYDLYMKMMWAKLDFFHGNIYNIVFLDKKIIF